MHVLKMLWRVIVKVMFILVMFAMECIANTKSDMIFGDAMEISSTIIRERRSLVKDNVYILDHLTVHKSYFLEELANMSDHGPQFGCILKNMQVIEEISHRFTFGIIFKCNMCHERKTV